MNPTKLLTLTLLLTLLLSPFTLSAQADFQRPRPKVAVVLSGGGAKGVAHIKALKVIEEAGFPIDIITGTSMGSLIGGLYSIGWSTDELDSLVRCQDWTFLLTDQANPDAIDIDSRRLQNTYALWHALSAQNEGGGFIRGVNLDHLFDRLLLGYADSVDFNTLPIRFACVATDIVTNDEVDFHSGYLKQAMRASMSIPGVFAPVRIGNRVLVDGGLRNNYPVDLAIEMGADIIIGVSVQGDDLEADDINHTITVLQQIIDINCKNKYERNLLMSDIVMQVDVSGFSAASFTAASIETLLERGEKEARNHWDELINLRRRYQLDSVGRPAGFTHPRHDTRRRMMADGTPLLNKPIVGVAFRFDNEENGALQVGFRVPFHWGMPHEASASLRLGKRLRFKLEHFLYPHGITSPSFSYSYHRNDINIYSSGIRTYNIKYNQHRLALNPINSRFRKFKLRAGIVFDYYDYYDPVLSAGAKSMVLENEHFFSYYFEALINNENNWYHPTSGTLFQATGNYRTDNLLGYDGGPGIVDIYGIWRIALTPIPRLTFQPSLFGRALFREGDIPVAFSNALGSRQQIVDQQMAFPGIHSLAFADRILLAAQLKIQVNITKTQLIIARAATARNVLNISELTKDWPNLHGFSLGYCYNTMFGPIEADLGYSSLAPGLTFYLNIGHRF